MPAPKSENKTPKEGDAPKKATGFLPQINKLPKINKMVCLNEEIIKTVVRNDLERSHNTQADKLMNLAKEATSRIIANFSELQN